MLPWFGYSTWYLSICGRRVTVFVYYILVSYLLNQGCSLVDVDKLLSVDRLDYNFLSPFEEKELVWWETQSKTSVKFG